MRTASSSVGLPATHPATPLRSRLSLLGTRRCHPLLGTEKDVTGVFVLFTRIAQIGRRSPVQNARIDISNKRGAGKGGIPSLFHIRHTQPALPDHERSA
jgi:hypothetical protein